MQKIWRYCGIVFGRIIFIGFGVQIVMGLLWMFNAFAGLRGIGEGAVCVGQILLAGGSAFFFLHSIGVQRRWLKVFGSLAMLTFPMIMQCHMTMGIWSVVSSLLLCLTGWLIGSGEKRKILYRVTVMLVVAGIILSTNRVYQGKKGIAVCLASRFAWTTLAGTYGFWPPDYRDKIEHSVVWQSNYEANGIQRFLAPYLEEKEGRKEAQKMLLEVSSVAWQRQKGRILKEIVWDLAGYTIPPIVVPLQLEGRAYDSYTGFNYEDILGSNPRLGKVYMDYCCWWFKVGLVLAILLSLSKLRNMHFRGVAIVALSGGMMAFVYAMSGAGCMDYRNTAYILCAWLALMVKMAGEAGLSGGRSDE